MSSEVETRLNFLAARLPAAGETNATRARGWIRALVRQNA